MKSSFYWLLFFCIRAIGENITLSSDHGLMVFEINDASPGVVDQHFWENFETFFPGYYFSGSTIMVYQPSPTHFHYTLTAPEEASTCLAMEEGVYRCPFCARVSRNRRTMYDHIRLHYGINIHCSICGNKFKYMPNFSRHHKEH